MTPAAWERTAHAGAGAARHSLSWPWLRAQAACLQATKGMDTEHTSARCCNQPVCAVAVLLAVPRGQLEGQLHAKSMGIVCSWCDGVSVCRCITLRLADACMCPDLTSKVFQRVCSDKVQALAAVKHTTFNVFRGRSSQGKLCHAAPCSAHMQSCPCLRDNCFSQLLSLLGATASRGSTQRPRMRPHFQKLHSLMVSGQPVTEPLGHSALNQFCTVKGSATSRESGPLGPAGLTHAKWCLSRAVTAKVLGLVAWRASTSLGRSLASCTSGASVLVLRCTVAAARGRYREADESRFG